MLPQSRTFSQPVSDYTHICLRSYPYTPEINDINTSIYLLTLVEYHQWALMHVLQFSFSMNKLRLQTTSKKLYYHNILHNSGQFLPISMLFISLKNTFQNILGIKVEVKIKIRRTKFFKIAITIWINLGIYKYPNLFKLVLNFFTENLKSEKCILGAKMIN